MAQQRMLLGHVKGDKGDTGADADISSVGVTVNAGHLAQPTATATVTGGVGSKVINFTFSGLQGATGTTGAAGKAGIDAKITAVTVTVDKTHSDTPTCKATVSGDPGAQTLTLAFTGLMGATGAAGPAGPAGPAGEFTGTSTQVTLGDGTPRDITALGKVATATTADKLGTADVGSASAPVYLVKGVATASSGLATQSWVTGTAKAKSAAAADTATTATKLGTGDVGSATTPIYLAAGVPKAANAYPTIPGVVSKAANGLCPKLPTDPNV